MLTCCPECKTCFRITQDQLNVAQGLVRCGQCAQVFNARQNLKPEKKPPVAASVSSPAKPEVTPTPVPPAKENIPAPDFSTDFKTEFSADEFAATPSDTENDGIDFDLDHRTEQEAGQANETETHYGFSVNSEASPLEESPFYVQEESLSTDDLSMLADTPARPVSEQEEVQKEEKIQTSLFDDFDEPDHLNEIKLFDDTPEPEPEPETESNFDEFNDLAHDAEETEIKTSVTSYHYTDINDAIKEEQNLDDLFSDMDQQLNTAAEEGPEKNSQDVSQFIPEEEINLIVDEDYRTQKDPDDSALTHAIDSIFMDSFSSFGDSKIEKNKDTNNHEKEDAFADLAQRDHSAKLGHGNSHIQYEEIEMQGIGEHLDGPHTKNDDFEDIPLRLRDSIAEAKPTSWWKKLLGLLFLLILLVAMAAQAALFRNLDIVNMFPQTQPLLEIYCGYLPCRVHAQRDIDQIKITDRDIRVHPSEKKALLITATIINKASFHQPYPDIEVMLSDLTGATVAHRRFTPADYMGKLNTPFLLMKPGTPVHISIGVLDPGKDAVNFEFSFL
ncbi:MAG: DUF3426 domain-containing protein [Gammaproteobacteria bacterium]|nr:DUF3426 domain-containing protein [Gammaproteobacteria bacterium]